MVRAGAVALGGRREAGSIACRMRAGAGFVNHAAKINVRADFGAQPAFRDDVQFMVEFALDRRGGLFVSIEVCLLASYFQMAAARKVGVDIFLADDPLDAINRLDRSSAPSAKC